MMLKQLVSFLGLGVLTMSTLSLVRCGGDVGIVVSVENWPASSPYLLIDTQVNGVPGQQLRVPAGQRRFVVRLPGGQVGDLSLNAFAMDDTGCKVAQGQLAASLNGGLRRTEEGTLTLSGLEPALCKLSVQINSGSGTVASTPTGLRCTGNFCEGEFSRNTVVQLDPTPGSYQQFSVWSGNCTGNGTCDLSVARSTIAQIAFMPRLCTSQGWCFHHALDPSGRPIFETSGRYYSSSIDDQGAAWLFGSSGAILRCDIKSCKQVVVGFPLSSAAAGSVFSTGSIWATGTMPNPILFKCAGNACTTSYDFNQNDDCKGLVPNGTIFSSGQNIVTMAGNGTINKAIIGISINETAKPRCVKYFDAGTGYVSEIYANGFNLWAITNTPELKRFDCSPQTCTPAAVATNIPTMFSFSYLSGDSRSAWLASNQYATSTILVRCSAADAKCQSVSVPYKTSDYIHKLSVNGNSAWVIGKNQSSAVGTNIIYYGGMDPVTPAVIQNDYSLYNLYAAWSSDTDLWMGVDTNIRHCSTSGCETITPNAPNRSSVYIYSITGDSKNVWAGGYSGEVLHYQLP